MTRELPLPRVTFHVSHLTFPLPLLPLLQQTVHPSVARYTETLIKHSATPATVSRLTLEYAARPEIPPAIGPATLILKRIQPEYPADPGFPDREFTFYTRILPQLDIPHPQIYFTGIDPETQERLILMEDLTTYHLPPPTRPWTQAEGECMARAYARLHTVSRIANPANPDWLLQRHETRLDADMLGKMACDLIRQNVWEPIPGLEGLIARTVDAAQTFIHLPTTLLHNDVYPPNVALPPNLNDDAILLDWEMASSGLAEMDLGFMFLQPYRAHQCLDKARVLDAYWAARHAWEGEIPAREERDIRQFYADAVWGLWLVPVAHKMAAHPFPPGSAVATYWQSMFGVLEAHLRGLSGRVLL
ncbi:MAG TPA: phosphotransferase [Anaerolineales bacterium]|nr:phosphotransferase [Anaerolineales bacterium]